MQGIEFAKEGDRVILTVVTLLIGVALAVILLWLVAVAMKHVFPHTAEQRNPLLNFEKLVVGIGVYYLLHVTIESNIYHFLSFALQSAVHRDGQGSEPTLWFETPAVAFLALLFFAIISLGFILAYEWVRKED